MKKRRIAPRFIGVALAGLLASLLIAGCGQKGPLHLPEADSTEAPAAEQEE
ncbi:MAG: LPS translocon maturation chaperone LptM [Pseudomonadota bacterium]